MALCFAGGLKAQSGNIIFGKISYISSQNIYVKFELTENIQIGDTLYLKKESTFIPILVVLNQSSTSCVCRPISNSIFLFL